ncbi:MAG: hypothetical protein RJQ09_01405 [Cyclobacteriaceae bacterium]
MNFIWYNPDLKKYEFGAPDIFRRLKLQSANSSRFVLLSNVTSNNPSMADRVANHLNAVRGL